MGDDKLEEGVNAQEHFLLVTDNEFFGVFPPIDAPGSPFDILSSPFNPPLWAFKSNLSSAVLVGTVPFRLASHGVVNEKENTD